MYKKIKTMLVVGPLFFFLGLGIIVWQTTLWVGLGLFMLIIGIGINIKNREIISKEGKDVQDKKMSVHASELMIKAMGVNCKICDGNDKLVKEETIS